MTLSLYSSVHFTFFIFKGCFLKISFFTYTEPEIPTSVALTPNFPGLFPSIFWCFYRQACSYIICLIYILSLKTFILRFKDWYEEISKICFVKTFNSNANKMNKLQFMQMSAYFIKLVICIFKHAISENLHYKTTVINHLGKYSDICYLWCLALMSNYGSSK